MLRLQAPPARIDSPMRILGENVVTVLHQGVAGEPAFRVVSLRWACRLGGRTKRVGSRVILERGPSPSAAVCEPLAVLDHEIGVILGTWYGWWAGICFLFL